MAEDGLQQQGQGSSYYPAAALDNPGNPTSKAPASPYLLRSLVLCDSAKGKINSNVEWNNGYSTASSHKWKQQVMKMDQTQGNKSLREEDKPSLVSENSERDALWRGITMLCGASTWGDVLDLAIW